MKINEKSLPTPLTEAGGEGIIYEYQNKILKIYRKDIVNISEKKEKVEKLIKKRLPSNVIKPLEMVFNLKGDFIGYTMNKVEGEDFSTLSKKKHVKVNNISTKDIIKMLQDIKNTLIELHKNGIVIGDLNDGNILYDKNFNIYFIDTDSWSIDDIRCTVAMDLFKDPFLKSNFFTNETDAYAFAVLAFKSLTKIHPFGGVTDPDMQILERMKQGISVLNSKGLKLTIPKTINKWTFVSPDLLNQFESIFENKDRNMLDKHLDSLYKNLKFCATHNDYYFGKYSKCPLCNDNAPLTPEVPIKNGTMNGIPYIVLMSGIDIKTVLSLNSYINFNNEVVHKDTNTKIPFSHNYRYYFSDKGTILYATNDKDIHIKVGDDKYSFEKKFKSNILVKDDKVYFLNLNNFLVELTINKLGNSIQNICKTSSNSIFSVVDDKTYFVCDMYSNMKIINVSGYEYTLNNNDKIINYGMHYDKYTKSWLFVTENQKGIFNTYVFEKNNLLYETDKIKYNSSLSNLSFEQNTIFKAGDKLIRGFNYTKNAYKDFMFDEVNEDSKLMKDGSKFYVINEQNIYKLG